MRYGAEGKQQQLLEKRRVSGDQLETPCKSDCVSWWHHAPLSANDTVIVSRAGPLSGDCDICGRHVTEGLHPLGSCRGRVCGEQHSDREAELIFPSRTCGGHKFHTAPPPHVIPQRNELINYTVCCKQSVSDAGADELATRTQSPMHSEATFLAIFCPPTPPRF